MSIPLEALKSMGLSPEQIATIEAMAQSNNPRRVFQDEFSKLSSPASSMGSQDGTLFGRQKHDELSRHLDRILNAPSGLSKWSTDPINRVGFLLPSEKPTIRRQSNNYMSKSVENMLKAQGEKVNSLLSGSSEVGGKENKRISEYSPAGLKKAKSTDELGRDCYVRSSRKTQDEDDDQSPLQQPKKQLYSWGSPAPSTEDRTQQPIATRRFLLAKSELQSASQTPFKADISQSSLPSSSAFHIPEPRPEPSMQETSSVAGAAVEAQSAEAPKPYSLKDLLLELEDSGSLPSASSSLHVQLSPSDGDKYGSFYDLLKNNESTAADVSDQYDQVSVTQTEPVMRHYQAPMSAITELSSQPFCEDLLEQDYSFERKPSVIKPAAQNVLQSRFASKYRDSMENSQATIIGDMSVDSMLCDDDQQVYSPSSELSKYPLMSPSYNCLLRQSSTSQSPSRLTSARPELAELEDPATSVLLQGMREEICAQDSALYLNYRNCIRHSHTAIPLSFQELKQRIEEFGLDIQFKEEKRTTDVKQVFLLPINTMTVPRWVPPGMSFRVGRGSNWFISQTRVISRNHCEIFHDIHSYYLKDVGSRSGTFVNGTRISEPEAISMPRELRHGDILQIGVDFSAEKDQFGHLSEKFKCGQCMVLYGYKAKATFEPAAAAEFKPSARALDVQESPMAAAAVSPKTPTSPRPTSTSLTVSDSKFERMARKALALKSKLASANTRLFVEFGDYISDTSAGTAILHRPSGEPSYSFIFNNYKYSWDIGVTCRETGKHLGLSFASQSDDGMVYSVFEGVGMERCVAKLTVQGQHKCLLEPVYEWSAMDEEEQSPAEVHQPGAQMAINIASPSAYLVAGSASPAKLTSPFTQMPVISVPVPVSQLESPHKARNPFYTLTGDLSSSALAFYVQRYPSTRKQIFLGEGQVSTKKSAWGKKTIFYEARLPAAEQHDELLALATLFNVLNQLEKI